MTIFTIKFWQYAGERALKTVAQTAAATITVTGVSGVLDVMWSQVISASLLAGLISILTSIVAVSPATPGQGE